MNTSVGYTLDNNLEPAVGDVVRIRIGTYAGKIATLRSKGAQSGLWKLEVNEVVGLFYREHEFTRLFRPQRFGAPPKKPLRTPRKKSRFDGVSPGQSKIFEVGKYAAKMALTRWLKKNPDQEWSWGEFENKVMFLRNK